MSCGYIFIL
jgi:hypothetical protein